MTRGTRSKPDAPRHIKDQRSVEKRITLAGGNTTPAALILGIETASSIDHRHAEALVAVVATIFAAMGKALGAAFIATALGGSFMDGNRACGSDHDEQHGNGLAH